MGSKPHLKDVWFKSNFYRFVSVWKSTVLWLLILDFKVSQVSNPESWMSVRVAELNPCCYWQSRMEDTTGPNSPHRHWSLLCSLTAWLVRELDDGSCFHVGELRHQRTRELVSTHADLLLKSGVEDPTRSLANNSAGTLSFWSNLRD